MFVEVDAPVGAGIRIREGEVSDRNAGVLFTGRLLGGGGRLSRSVDSPFLT